jgi:DNA-binding transcriptional ArsR family regulator
MRIALDHDRIFGALGDATRRDIVRRAIDGHEGVVELAAHYPMSFAAVQKHVATLERAGLVSKHRSRRRKVVRTNLAGLRVAREPARPVRGAVARARRAHEPAHRRLATRASSSAGGDRRRTRRRSILTTCAPAATSSTT